MPVRRRSHQVSAKAAGFAGENARRNPDAIDVADVRSSDGSQRLPSGVPSRLAAAARRSRTTGDTGATMCPWTMSPIITLSSRRPRQALHFRADGGCVGPTREFVDPFPSDQAAQKAHEFARQQAAPRRGRRRPDGELDRIDATNPRLRLALDVSLLVQELRFRMSATAASHVAHDRKQAPICLCSAMSRELRLWATRRLSGRKPFSASGSRGGELVSQTTRPDLKERRISGPVARPARW